MKRDRNDVNSGIFNFAADHRNFTLQGTMLSISSRPIPILSSLFPFLNLFQQHISLSKFLLQHLSKIIHPRRLIRQNLKSAFNMKVVFNLRNHLSSSLIRPIYSTFSFSPTQQHKSLFHSS